MTGFGKTSEISIDFGCFSIYVQFKVHAQLSWACKKFYNLGGHSLSFSISVSE